MAGRITRKRAVEALASGDDPEYAILLAQGGLEVGYYRPHGVDRQTPHERDELYVVASGTGYFVNGDSGAPFEPGELLFVPAGVVHRFEDFSEDFAAWVVFFSPQAGAAD